MTVRNVRVSTEPGVQAGRIDTCFTCFARHALAVIAGACVACAPAARAPSGIPPAVPPPPSPPPVVAAPARWLVATPSTPMGYALQSHAFVAASADSLARTDTLETATAVRVTPRGAALDVTVSAYVVRSPTGAGRTLPSAVRAVGRFDSAGGITFEGAGLADCASMASAAIDATRDLWIQWPVQLSVGDQWRDSISTTACRDAVPLRLTLVRGYHVAAIADSQSRELTIERRSTLHVSGSGVIRGDTTTLTGDGTGTATLRLSAATGWLVDGTAVSTLQLRARGTRRTQLVEQRVSLTFRQQPGGAP